MVETVRDSGVLIPLSGLRASLALILTVTLALGLRLSYVGFVA
jgi:hypothetical protein